MTQTTSALSSLAGNVISTALSRLPVTIKASTAPATGTNAKLTKAAHDFEAIFMRQLMSSADKSDFGSDLFSSQGMSTFRSMQEGKFADTAAARDTLGIAKLLESRLAAHGVGGAKA